MESILPKYETTLRQCFLFSGFDGDRLARALSGRGEVAVFAAGQTIFSPHSFKRAVGIFLQGKAQAEKTAEGRAVVLNRFEPPMMFGAAAVFRQAKEYVTQVTALTRCRVLFLTDEELDAIFREDFGAARNYISFLSERIAFLNRKIDSFTQGSAEEKMALYLHDQCMGRAGAFSIACSPTRLSRELGVSRATVYRALERFCRLGYIRRTGAQLEILNAQGLLDWQETTE
ncbi:MAG: Crp/Fnr family transcriptional regulator [Oscillospiraceae bacterium]|nr:Crp/Fnr family transcriptional regulator [Oscillospiraceae bacterium]